jgi:hypothetical protein
MKKLLVPILSAIIGLTSYGQTSQITTILTADIAQGEKLIEAYFTPMSESFGASLNNGWYNTAKPHKLGGFDVTFTVNTVIIPTDAKAFKVEDAFGNIFTSNEPNASTVLGSTDATAMIYKNSSSGIETSFDMPGGFETPVMPLPMIQAGIGLIKNTAIDIRYMPMLNVGDNINVNLFGAGVKHDLLQWIPAIGDAIPMSLSLQAGYTSLNTELEISNQEVSLNTKATTINIVASKKILMFTGYAGIGYNSAKTTFSSNNTFELGDVQFDEQVEIDFESNNNLRTNIGLRLNMAVVTIQADYTFSKYPTATLGLGVSLR